ncbi:MAG TPA: DUF6054 family protein [Actinomycetales bacterium]|nr:DUF6054 family protein [Actinomycetales bacterium]
MAQYQHELTADVDSFVTYLDQAIPRGSITAKFEAGSDSRVGDARMVVRAYERFSAIGGNRVSLCISILAVGEQLALSAVTAGGSQAMFFKINRFGEDAFLTHAIRAIEAYTAA